MELRNWYRSIKPFNRFIKDLGVNLFFVITRRRTCRLLNLSDHGYGASRSNKGTDHYWITGSPELSTRNFWDMNLGSMFKRGNILNTMKPLQVHFVGISEMRRPWTSIYDHTIYYSGHECWESVQVGENSQHHEVATGSYDENQ